MNFFTLHLFELKCFFFFLFLLFFYTFLLIYSYIDLFFFFFCNNFLIELKITNHFIFTNLIDLFIFKFFFSFLISIFFTFYLFLFQCWIFISSGLYKIENLLIIKLFFFSSFIFIFSFIFSVFYFLPNIIDFFFQIPSTNFFFHIYFEPKLNEYLIFIIKVLIYNSIIFQYPLIILYFLYKKINIISPFFRKIYYFQILLFSTILSPPDFYSQIYISFPLFLFYELSLFLLLFYKKLKI